MTRRILLLLWAAFPALSAEALKVTAQPDGKDLRIRVEGPLPRRAVLTVRLEREVGSLAPEFIYLRDLHDMTGENGVLEIASPFGEALSVPGRYRVTAEYDPDAQYPDVAAQIPVPPTEGSCILQADLLRKPYLEAVLSEQAVLEKSYAEVCVFLVRLNELKAHAKQDRPAAAKAWAEWRAKAVPAMEAIEVYDQELSSRFFPKSSSGSGTLHKILEWELAQFQAARDGGLPRGRGPYKGLERIPPETFDPWKALLVRESVLYRLSVINLIAGERRERRASLEETLALAGTGLPSPWKEKVSDLVQALRAWWDTGSEKDLAALKDRYSALRAEALAK